MLCPGCTSWIVCFWAVKSLHTQPVLFVRCVISCLQNSMRWCLCAWQGQEHGDNPSVVALTVTGVRSLSEATWLPSEDIIYDANEMWACLGHQKAGDESAAPSSSSITEVPPACRTLQEARACSSLINVETDAPPRLSPLIVSSLCYCCCRLSPIRSWTRGSILIQSHCEKCLTLPKDELNHQGE